MTKQLTARDGQLYLDCDATGVEFDGTITASTVSSDVADLVSHLFDFTTVDHDKDTIFLSNGKDD